MIRRSTLITFIVLLAGLIAGYFAAGGVGKDLSELTNVRTKSDSSSVELPHRILDIGGVGVLPDTITSEWIRGYFGTDSSLAVNLAAYFEASYDVRTLGPEPSPKLWIFEWDILGASSAAWSNIYFLTRDHFQQVIDEGFEAVKGAIARKDLLLDVREDVTNNLDDYDRLLASVDYEIELFRLQDYYRQFFMNYYRWIDTGNAQSKATYKMAMGQFKAVMKYHEDKYAGSLNVPVMDFNEVKTGIAIAERNSSTVSWAKVIVVVALFLLVLGIPGLVRDRAHRKFAGSLYFDTLFRPYRVNNTDACHGTRRMILFMLLLYILGLFVFSSFSAIWFPLSMGLLGLIFVFGLALFLNNGTNFMNILISLLAPKVIIMAFILVTVAIRGPMFFWYQIWVSDLFKLIFLSLFVMLIFRKLQVYIVMGMRWNQRNAAGSASLVFLMLGIQLLLLGFALNFFGLEDSITALNDELLVLPGGFSKIMGITTHLGIPLDLPLRIIYASSVIILVSSVIFLFNRQSGIRSI